MNLPPFTEKSRKDTSDFVEELPGANTQGKTLDEESIAEIHA